MSTTATQAQAAHQPAAAEASQSKRKRDEAEDHADAKLVKRKHDFDLDILDCPMCMKPFAPPVFQCHNGHTACLACCKKINNRKCTKCDMATGGIRCIAIEKLVESLSVSCKYARHGCEEMERPSGIENHEAHCKYEPFHCPVPKCDYEASRDPLLWHLTEVHHIKTKMTPIMAHSSRNTVHLTMGPSNRIVMVMVKVEKTHIIYLVHCEVHEHLGDIFFCTSFGGFDIEEYNLRVWHRGDSVSHSMDKARPIHLRYMKEYLKKNFLLLPAKATTGNSFEVDFTLIACLPTKASELSLAI